MLRIPRNTPSSYLKTYLKIHSLPVSNTVKIPILIEKREMFINTATNLIEPCQEMDLKA